MQNFYYADSTLQIETSLDPNDYKDCTAIYEQIWVNPGTFSAWARGKLLIFDRNDQFMCGGAA